MLSWPRGADRPVRPRSSSGLIGGGGLRLHGRGGRRGGGTAGSGRRGAGGSGRALLARERACPSLASCGSARSASGLWPALHDPWRGTLGERRSDGRKAGEAETGRARERSARVGACPAARMGHAGDAPPTPGAHHFTMWLELVLILSLIILNAALAGSEMALVSLREGQLVRLEQRSEAGRLVARLARDPNRFLSAIQVGLTLAGFLASAVAAVSLAQPLVEPLGFLGRSGRTGGDPAGHDRADLLHARLRRAGAQAGRHAAGRAVGADRSPATVRPGHRHPPAALAARSFHRPRRAADGRRPRTPSARR